MKIVKEVAWSYPTSLNAKSFGFIKEGCWTVQIHGMGDYIPVAVAGFATRPEALFHAERINVPWSTAFQAK